jgi:hypothetical protein
MRHYATRDDGKRVLVEITCDEPGCDASIKPHLEIAKSGWMKTGQRIGSGVGDFSVQDWCPAHTPTGVEPR